MEKRKEGQKIPNKLISKLEKRANQGLLRTLKTNDDSLEDFSSNDYLGLAVEPAIQNMATKILNDYKLLNQNGAKGSRLLNGNHDLYLYAETFLSNQHHSESALIYNSGYTANIGLLSAVLSRNTFVIYDELIHASLRDAIQFSQAKGYKYAHNDAIHIQNLLEQLRTKHQETTILLVTEAVFSMDGDLAPLDDIIALCKKFDVYLIIDEAHATATPHHQAIENKVKNHAMARVLTFGKSLGVHGACILCSNELRSYLINFSRSFIYTTALPPHTLATVIAAYQFLNNNQQYIKYLEEVVNTFKIAVDKNQLSQNFLNSHTPIQSLIVGSNSKAKQLEALLKEHGFDIRAILSPTVPTGTERLRICLHAYNSKDAIERLMQLLKKNL